MTDDNAGVRREARAHAAEPDDLGSWSRRFDELRPGLLAVAYRLTGSRVDAEDVVQDAWLRLHRALDSPASPDPAKLRAWATVTVSRLALDLLRSARARRESYVGPWLPEPWVVQPATPATDPYERATLAESVSFALLVVLETLSPAERTSFVLHDMFGLSFEQVAEIVGRSPQACRQLAVRARAHVAERAPRFDADSRMQDRAVRAFLAAAASGDIGGLIRTLDPGVVLRSDGGGKAPAARHPVMGADRVAQLFLGIAAKPPEGSTIHMARVNGVPGVLVRSHGRLVMVISLTAAQGRITEIALLVNPDKLRRVSDSMRAVTGPDDAMAGRPGRLVRLSAGASATTAG